MGARGTGKSGSCIMEGLRAASKQNLSRTGVRRSKFLVLRDTYRQLETTTIPSFKKWLGPVSRISGQYPIRALTRIPSLNHDGTAVEMETIFLAMDGENIIDNLMSFEASFAWINEARAIERSDIVNMVLSSCGRFPSKDEEGCPAKFVVMDSNPPDENHWWYHADMVERPDGWGFYTQEPPLNYLLEGQRSFFTHNVSDYEPNPRATYANIQNSGYSYWLDQIPGASDAFIRTMVMGRYGTFVAGKPVYGHAWTEDVIAKEPIKFVQPIDLVIGIDTSGLHPGAAFGQMYGGTLRVLEELHVADVPFEEFVDGALIPFVMERFPGASVTCSLDPSNPRSGIGGKTAMQILRDRGIRAVLAPVANNNLNQRIGYVTKFLVRRNAMVINKHCRLLIDGFRGKYHYEKMEQHGLAEAFKPKPVKDKYADVHDGLQYLCAFFSASASEAKVILPQRKVLYA